MPLPDNFELPKPEQFPVVEDDTYQVKIDDVEDVDGKDFNTGEPQPQLKFSFSIVDPGEDYGKKVVKWVSMKYAPAKAGRPESNLHAIVTKALKREVSLDELKLNNLIGKQLRLVVVKVERDDGMFRNKITGYMTTKKDVSLDGQPAESTDTVEIKPEDIPF